MILFLRLLKSLFKTCSQFLLYREVMFVRKILNFVYPNFTNIRTRNELCRSREDLFKISSFNFYFLLIFPYSFILTMEVFPCPVINRKQNSGKSQVSKADAKVFFQ